MSVRIRRLIIIATVGALTVLALIYGFWPKAILVETAEATRGPFLVTIEEEGKTRVKERFVISAPVAGFMRRVDLRAGDSVDKGGPLFILEPLRPQVLDSRSRAEAQSVVAAAQATIEAAEKQEQSAKVEADFMAERLSRFKRLLETGIIAREDYDQTEAQANQTQALYLAAQAGTHAARSELKRAQSVLAYSAAGPRGNDREMVIVRSPRSGRVLRVYRESEGAVAMGEPVLEIGDPEDIEVRVELLSADAVRVRPGTAVTFERWGGETKLKGLVRTIEPSGFTKISSLGVEEQRVLVVLDMISEPALRPHLGDGYRVEASFIVWEGRDILQIPARALFRYGEHWAVFAAAENRARRKTVEVGQRNGLHAEILAGIGEGDLVIAQPDDAIREGSRIRLRKTVHRLGVVD